MHLRYLACVAGVNSGAHAHARRTHTNAHKRLNTPLPPLRPARAGARDIGMKVQAFAFQGYWEDIGTVEAFYNSNLALANPATAQFRCAEVGGFWGHAPRFSLADVGKGEDEWRHPPVWLLAGKSGISGGSLAPPPCPLSLLHECARTSAAYLRP